MTTEDEPGHSSAPARTPAPFSAARRLGARFAAARSLGRLEHAVTGGGTLCGLERDEVTVYRHLFSPNASSACPRCRELTGAARPAGD